MRIILTAAVTFILVWVNSPSVAKEASSDLEPIKLHFVYSEAAPPYSYSIDGKARGILVDLADHILDKLPEITVYHETFPWKRAQKLVQGGEADGFITVPTEARLRYVDCTDSSIIISELYLLVRKDNPKMSNLRSIRTLRNAKNYVAISSNGTDLDKQYLTGVGVVLASSDLLALRMLIGGRGDFFIATIAEIELLKKIKGGEKIVVLPAPYLPSSGFHFCLRKSLANKALLLQINERVKQVLSSEEYKQIFQKYKIAKQGGNDRTFKLDNNE